MKCVSFCMTVFLLWGTAGWSQCDSPKYEKQIAKYRKAEHQKFRDPRQSPLRENYRAYDHLDYFPVDRKYCVEARLELTPDSPEFEMTTSSGQKKQYKKWAIARFELDGQEYALSLYTSLALANIPKYKDYLFLPFKDFTNGNETYGGGRYIEMHIPEGNTLVIDFNKAFNPYCAYSATGWNCPVPPEENHLQTFIHAGVKDWGH
ncbi:MAG: DUF1684 domain-containing protein [Bacteroidia bacterium]|nr:DUF1684 domain-containing protein [Bacteroidia bacterium]